MGYLTAKDILTGLPAYYRYNASQHPTETWRQYAYGLRHPDWTTPATMLTQDDPRAALYVTEKDRQNDTGAQS